MKRVGIAELKNALSRTLRLVERGEVVEVLDRARPIARIVPTARSTTVAIRPATRPFASIRDRTYPRLTTEVDSLALLRQERADTAPPTQQS